MRSLNTSNEAIEGGIAVGTDQMRAQCSATAPTAAAAVDEVGYRSIAGAAARSCSQEIHKSLSGRDRATRGDLRSGGRGLQ